MLEKFEQVVTLLSEFAVEYDNLSDDDQKAFRHQAYQMTGTYAKAIFKDDNDLSVLDMFLDTMKLDSSAMPRWAILSEAGWAFYDYAMNADRGYRVARTLGYNPQDKVKFDKDTMLDEYVAFIRKLGKQVVGRYLVEGDVYVDGWLYTGGRELTAEDIQNRTSLNAVVRLPNGS